MENDILRAAKDRDLQAMCQAVLTYVLTGYLLRKRSRLVFWRDCLEVTTRHCHRVNHLEYFARLAPFFAAWLAGGRDRVIQDGHGLSVDLLALITDELAAGTNPTAPTYWGEPVDFDQRICEAADICLTLWLLETSGQPVVYSDHLCRWLDQCARRPVRDNNWQLFSATINLVGAQVGRWGDQARGRAALARMLQFYRGDGWFQDGDEGHFDYYNSWAVHYSLHFLAQIDPEIDRSFTTDALRQFNWQFRHLFTPSTCFPAYGRSLVYRLAFPTSFACEAAGSRDDDAIGLANRALLSTWRHYITNGAIANGRFTNGFYGSCVGLLENYSGPYSAFWNLRGLIPLLRLPHDHAIWQPADARFPIESADYDLVFRVPNWRVVGRQSTQRVCLYPLANTGAAWTPTKPYRRIDHLASVVSMTPNRPNNKKAKYGNPVYCSDTPFFARKEMPAK